MRYMKEMGSCWNCYLEGIVNQMPGGLFQIECVNLQCQTKTRWMLTEKQAIRQWRLGTDLRKGCTK